MLVARQFYSLKCDAPGCESRSPNLDSEVQAWADPVDVINNAADEEWLIKEGTHWCFDHVVFCAVCEGDIVPSVIKICDACLKINDEKGGLAQQGHRDQLANYRRESHHHD